MLEAMHMRVPGLLERRSGVCVRMCVYTWFSLSAALCLEFSQVRVEGTCYRGHCSRQSFVNSIYLVYLWWIFHLPVGHSFRDKTCGSLEGHLSCKVFHYDLAPKGSCPSYRAKCVQAASKCSFNLTCPATALLSFLWDFKAQLWAFIKCEN